MTPTRVLVVDDHAIVRNGIQMLLSTAPSMEIVGEAENGQEAVQKAAELQPDVVLMDVVMPGGDGVRATIEIKRLLPNVKIIMLTGFSEEGTAREAIKAGADGYLLKDAGNDDLVKAILAVQHGGVPLNPQIASHFLKNSGRRALSPDTPHLTTREQQILRLVANGLSNKSIAEALGLRPGTVKIHVSNILKKLNAANRTEAATWATHLS